MTVDRATGFYWVSEKGEEQPVVAFFEPDLGWGIWGRYEETPDTEVTVLSGRLELSAPVAEVELRAEVEQLRAQVSALESLRPHWAQGYTSDSIAAQTTTAALAHLWGLLGAKDQTEASAKLRAALAADREGE